MSDATHHRHSTTILTIDDDLSLLQVIGMRLEAHGYQVMSAPDGRTALEFAKDTFIDLAIVDYKLDGEDGMSLMEKLWELQSGLPVIILTAYGTINNAVDAMQRGACNYLTKPFDWEELERRIDNCLEKSRQLRPCQELTAQQNDPPFFSGIIAESPEMKTVMTKVRQVAITDSNVYIEGESGTGKELVARCLHEASQRKEGPFVAINCGAIPENLFESELLGYEKGAFTSADSRRDGLLTRANGGSFFFDEISELPLSMQVKLLRILEEREFYPLGSNQKVKIDVRIIAAANRNLEKLMRDGLFREDLFYRIHVIPISLPPLRKRKADILPLANHFLADFCQETGKPLMELSPSAAKKLIAADWPGNVRELENVMEYAVAMATDTLLTPELITCSMTNTEEVPPLRVARKNFEKEYLVQLMKTHNGNVSQAARMAGKYRADFYTLLRKHGLDPIEFRGKE